MLINFHNIPHQTNRNQDRKKKKISKFVIKKTGRNLAWRACRVSKRLYELEKKVDKEITGLRIPFDGQKELKNHDYTRGKAREVVGELKRCRTKEEIGFMVNLVPNL